MKKFFMKTSMASAMVLALAPPAFATCVEDGMCLDSYQKITVGGNANFGGFGSGMFVGQEGGVKVEKAGYGSTDLKLNMAGDACGTDCQSGSFEFKALAGETVSVISGALGTKSGETVSTINQGGAFSNATFQFGKQNIPAY